MDLDHKRQLFLELTRRLTAEYETLVSAHQATQAGATHEEAKPENDKDTRALEQSYLARGQAERVLSLEKDLLLLKNLEVRPFQEDAKITLGAFVRVEDDKGVEFRYLLAPAGAGETLRQKELTIKVVTQHSPLGGSLIGAKLDEEVQVRSPMGLRTLCITELS